MGGNIFGKHTDFRNLSEPIKAVRDENNLVFIGDKINLLERQLKVLKNKKDFMTQTDKVLYAKTKAELIKLKKTMQETAEMSRSK